MRKIIVLLAICIGAATGYAQEQQTLLGGAQDISLFVSPALKGTLLNTQRALMAGGSAGILLDRTLYIGAAGYGLLSDAKVAGVTTDSASIDMGYGGGLIGYRFGPDNLLHFGVQAVLGYGEVKYGRPGSRHHEHDIFDSDTAGPHGSTGFYVAEPSLTAEVNILNRVQLGVEAGYRFCTGADSTMTGVTDKGLSGPSVAATLRVVVF